ncbi:hypothetical protein NCC49_004498 [Naganishia albida]|nr:hypothetical protein NCC49_004498 [Naganishia albida]
MFTTIRSITATASRVPRATAVRTLRTTPFVRTEDDPTKPNSFGHAVKKSHETLEGGMDVQSAGVQAGMKEKRDGKQTQAEPYDTAAESAGGQEAPSRQKEDALQDASTASQAAHSAGAFKDHRAGAQSSGEYAGQVGGKEEAAAPKVMAGVKQVLGLGTNKQEHQESKTGPGVSRQMHTSARWMAGGEEGKAFSGSKSEGSHKSATPDQRLEGDQNEHLKHKSAGAPDSGKGNAADTPHLPSKSGARAQSDLRTDSESQRNARRFSTSARQAKDAAAGYVAATENPAKAAGYDTPGETAVTNNYEGVPIPPQGDLKPSSALPHSTTAREPRHDVLGDQARDGTLADRNPQPTPEAGEIGLDDAWKKRDAELKGSKA